MQTSIKNEIISKICYTDLVYNRINKKLNTNYSKSEIEAYILNLLIKSSIADFEKVGKNYYVSNYESKVRITINSFTHRVITVDQLKGY